jgi:hypothetical protein
VSTIELSNAQIYPVDMTGQFHGFSEWADIWSNYESILR